MEFTQDNFESAQEFHFYERNRKIITPASDSFFPTPFYDSEGKLFNAQPDFLYKGLIWIEFKCFQLNNYEPQSRCFELLTDKSKFSSSLNYLKLKYHWSNSIYKQAAVSEAYPSHFLIVFKDQTKLSTQSKNLMNRLGINWCFEQEMPQRLELMYQSLQASA